MRFYHKDDQQMQVKNHSSRHRILAPISVLLILALAASLFSFAAVAGGESIYAKAADAAYEVTDLDITNADFSESDSSGTLSTPTSWTGTQIAGGSDSVKSGVVDLTDALSATELDELGLDESTVLRTPFGSNSANNEFAGSTAQALFIGSDSGAVYGYESTSVSLSSSSYYEISAWVKTSDFGANGGAAIKISGLENDVIIDGINTVQYYENIGKTNADSDPDCYYGWVRYSFFIETSTMSDPSVTITLMLGRSINVGDDETAKECLLKVLTLSPSNTEVMEALAAIYEAEGDDEKAEKYRHKVKVVKENREAEKVERNPGLS